MSLKAGILALSMITAMSSPMSLGSGDDTSVTDWNTVTIQQRSVGHESGCTVCSLQLIIQNSRTIDDYLQCEGLQDSDSGTYAFFDATTQGKDGFANGDSWNTETFLDYTNEYCDGTFSWADLSDVAKQVNNYTVGMWDKDFKSMSYEDQLRAMKYLWENGYYVAVGVEYKGVGQESNGVEGYYASHVTMLAGVDDETIWLNDPATGTIRDYKECSAKGGDYNIVYVLVFDNSETTPYYTDLSGKTNVIGFFIGE